MQGGLSLAGILSLLGTAGGLAVLWGVYLNRRQPEAQVRLITAQREEIERSRDLKSVEASNKAVDSLVRALDRAEATQARLEHEREQWQVRERIMEEQIKELAAQKICDQTEIGQLNAALKLPKAGNGKAK